MIMWGYKWHLVAALLIVALSTVNYNFLWLFALLISYMLYEETKK